MFDAMLDLFPGDSRREEMVAGMVDWVLREIAKVPGPEGRAALLDIIAQYPRPAMLALQHRWATPTRRLKTMRRMRAAAAQTRRGLVEISPARLKLQPEKARPSSRHERRTFSLMTSQRSS
jgi:hypothetical protein